MGTTWVHLGRPSRRSDGWWKAGDVDSGKGSEDVAPLYIVPIFFRSTANALAKPHKKLKFPRGLNKKNPKDFKCSAKILRLLIYMDLNYRLFFNFYKNFKFSAKL